MGGIWKRFFSLISLVIALYENKYHFLSRVVVNGDFCMYDPCRVIFHLQEGGLLMEEQFLQYGYNLHSKSLDIKNIRFLILK